jgi:hypothetical protein
MTFFGLFVQCTARHRCECFALLCSAHHSRLVAAFPLLRHSQYLVHPVWHESLEEFLLLTFAIAIAIAIANASSAWPTCLPPLAQGHIVVTFRVLQLLPHPNKLFGSLCHSVSPTPVFSHLILVVAVAATAPFSRHLISSTVDIVQTVQSTFDYLTLNFSDCSRGCWLLAVRNNDKRATSHVA